MTDLEIYDRAMYGYLSTISKNVLYSITSKAFQNMAKDAKYKDYIDYSLISFYRSPDIDIDLSRYQFSSAVFGDFVRLRENDEKKREARYVHNMPINLTYQIDIWATKERNVQETAIKLISKVFMQKQVIVAPMNPDAEEARFHIIDVKWTDNSDLEEENERGRLYRHTISITLEARLKLTDDVETTQFLCDYVDIYE